MLCTKSFGGFPPTDLEEAVLSASNELMNFCADFLSCFVDAIHSLLLVIFHFISNIYLKLVFT